MKQHPEETRTEVITRVRFVQKAVGGGGPSPPLLFPLSSLLPSLSLPPSLSFFPPLPPSLPLEVGPLNPARESGGAL